MENIAESEKRDGMGLFPLAKLDLSAKYKFYQVPRDSLATCAAWLDMWDAIKSCSCGMSSLKWLNSKKYGWENLFYWG
jgi:hypothetical protein